MKYRNALLLIAALVLSFPWACEAQSVDDPLGDLFSDEPEFLQEAQAFQFDFSQQGDELLITFDIAEGYYLYKKQFKTVTKDVTLGEPSFPPAVEIEDEFFGVSDVFFNELSVSFPIITAQQDGSVKLRYQGCAEAGLCYPPTVKVIYLDAVNTTNADNASEPADKVEGVSEQFALADRLSSEQGLALTLLVFLALGIGLAFTPCVFPMYPILSGIVIGQGKQIKTSRAFLLSFIYVQGMAITYSILGLIVASAGVKFQAALQHPAILIVLIVLFVLLALVMFGAYELQLPSKWQEKLNGLSNDQKSGSLFGVFVMGMISGLVASPCTTAPLTGILLFIAQSGDLLLGFVSLYALSIGMGIPLIIFGITGGKLLPKAGNWMNVVKTTFGFMMMAVAILFLERLWISVWTDIMYAVLGFATFTYFFVINQNSALTFWKGVRTFVIFAGLLGSALYGYTALSPQRMVASGSAGEAGVSEKGHPEFVVVRDLADFEAKLGRAVADGKSVMVDLYADWCVACKEFEKYTFPDPEVVDALSNTVWMQIDLTDNTPTSIEFQEQFSVLGLPTILFFDSSGNEIKSGRVTGFMRAEPFAQHVSRILPK
ncbi:protein-disulfide reductase DsbD [Alteromonas oceanisediminis]|uniref:protein-disulfide reductase DsbD n=1 Tax=Alteromonas oceanisediminis TaxID=2836180 RepID=UPI001BDA0973|nr:protein-disulfide reductase DsbD [Alteromonas oceanisediminis]MBT0586253.1 protein-disulfide reductase DsbD [Alteromonas oceanisediminis]